MGKPTSRKTGAALCSYPTRTRAVVVIHPLAGYREALAFATDTGRLCVALSRHRTYATVIVDSDSDLVLRYALAQEPNNTALAIQLGVLSQLLNSLHTGG